LANAWLLASPLVCAMAQPNPGVPLSGSSASATHWFWKVATILHKSLAFWDPFDLQPASALVFASSDVRESTWG
jgi:hypothetical protein